MNSENQQAFRICGSRFSDGFALGGFGVELRQHCVRFIHVKLIKQLKRLLTGTLSMQLIQRGMPYQTSERS
ncbi:hypothetical protein JJD61_06480 [Pseudomonas carnis]|uniref:hypothetical protein n=1 Tax=Pseudomonas TaxID=286 RepID=UPI001114D0BB|nr:MULTISPECIES: hypothetical protein [Pseudomonas]MBA6041722.1 hypothetical protein [Pseudomonas lactis]MBH3465177.1 hypothetical protein [Pseudomonas carnis]MBK3470328.1 hypothetical protein [Pseudomonas carnis]MBN1083607.1 hypothetical protein [Pseudomonas sp. 1079]MCO7037264.1 hypothetical protein [Pseudomonas carnis]